jgi:hypothetical protein
LPLAFLHFATDFLTVPPRVDQAEAHALYQGMASEESGALRVGDVKDCAQHALGQQIKSAFIGVHRRPKSYVPS